jgi:hypothetical protein
MNDLIIYDHLERMHEDEKNRLHIPFRHHRYARELMRKLAFDEDTYLHPLERALHACRSLGITESDHFCHVFCFGNESVYEDYAMSAFGTYLFIVNCDPSHPLVATAQLFH